MATPDHNSKPTGQLFSDEEWDSLIRRAQLTKRQARILRSVLQGTSDKQIATALQVHPATVRSHLQKLFAKFHVNDRTSLAVALFKLFREQLDEDSSR